MCPTPSSNSLFPKGHFSSVGPCHSEPHGSFNPLPSPLHGQVGGRRLLLGSPFLPTESLTPLAFRNRPASSRPVWTAWSRRSAQLTKLARRTLSCRQPLRKFSVLSIPFLRGVCRTLERWKNPMLRSRRETILSRCNVWLNPLE